MKTNKRFIRSIVDTARVSEVTMPWARGSRRTTFIAKRAQQVHAVRKSA